LTGERDDAHAKTQKVTEIARNLLAWRTPPLKATLIHEKNLHFVYWRFSDISFFGGCPLCAADSTGQRNPDIGSIVHTLAAMVGAQVSRAVDRAEHILCRPVIGGRITIYGRHNRVWRSQVHRAINSE